MASDPFFSIVLATYGRGRHIRPTIASVLGQSIADFELIVVGDECNDETEEVVRAFADARISWCNLPQNTGSQSWPNNEGIRRARGPWVCYIGHDDIWAPDHLQAIKQTSEAEGDADFVVSGCVYYGPRGSEVYSVTGLFDTPDAPFRYFFPPSSLAHRRDITQRIGGWRDPRVIKPAVDAEFLLRAAHAGLRFVSTGRVTAHKFAAGHRYLSYLRPSSDEQDATLQALMGNPVLDLDEIVSSSKRSGQFMSDRYPDFTTVPAGWAFEQNRRNKGLNRPPLQPLGAGRVLAQTDEARALDWYALEAQHGTSFRWSGPNPRPKILIPFTGRRVRVAIEVLRMGPGRWEDLLLYVEREKVEFTRLRRAPMLDAIVADINLNSADYTVLTLETPMFCPRDQFGGTDGRKLGIAVADIAIEPI